MSTGFNCSAWKQNKWQQPKTKSQGVGSKVFSQKDLILIRTYALEVQNKNCVCHPTHSKQKFPVLGGRSSLTSCKNIFCWYKIVEQNLHSYVNFWPWGWIKHCRMISLLVQNHPTSLRISKIAKDTIESLTTVLPMLVLSQVSWSGSLETTQLTVVRDSSVNSSLVVIKFSQRVWPVLTRLAIIFCGIMQSVFVLSQHIWSGSFILTLVTEYHVSFVAFTMFVHFRRVFRRIVAMFAHNSRIFLLMDRSDVTFQDVLWHQLDITQWAADLFSIVIFPFVDFQLFQGARLEVTAFTRHRLSSVFVSHVSCQLVLGPVRPITEGTF